MGIGGRASWRSIALSPSAVRAPRSSVAAADTPSSLRLSRYAPSEHSSSEQISSPHLYARPASSLRCAGQSPGQLK